MKIQLKEHSLDTVRLMVMDNLCCDIIKGQDLLKEHNSLVLSFSGNKPSLELMSLATVCSLTRALVDPQSLFTNASSDIRPIACSSRKCSEPELEFIRKTVNDLLENDIVRPSKSPWRAQVLVTGLDKPNSRPLMVVDYSRTVNKFTLLDAYPLPSIETVVNKVAKFRYFSTFDKSAYYQVPIRESEKPFTAFEAPGKFLEFNVIPFGIKNGLAAFQRVVDQIVDKEGLEGTFASYLDNITVGGDSKEEHDQNVANLPSLEESDQT